MKRSTPHALTGTLLALATLAACETTENSRPTLDPVAVSHSLSRVASCDAYLAHVKESAIQRMRAAVELDCQSMLSAAKDRNRGVDYATSNGDDMGAVADASPEAGGEQSGDFSRTNLQEAGVDEADMVKTDGTYIYTVSGNDLVIVRLEEGGVLEEVGRLTVTGYPAEMFLYKDTVTLFTRVGASDVSGDLLPPDPPEYPYNDNRPMADEAMEAMPYPYGGYRQGLFTAISIVDVTDKTAPTLVRTVEYAGEYVSSRRIGGAVRVVLSNALSVLDIPTWVYVDYWDMGALEAKQEINQACDALIDDNTDYIERLTLDQVLPRKYDSATGRDAPIAACTDIYAAKTPSGNGLLSVISLDLDDPTGQQTDAAVIGERGHVYASQDALYLTSAPDYVRLAWRTGLWEDETSGIHKFDIATDPAEALYIGSGAVTGRLLNQFSLGEHEGHLRVATTSGSAWGPEGENSLDNHLFVLGESDGGLVVTGSLSGIGTDEEIYAARFMGDRGFVVTFLQIDPLFTFDLSDPTDPKVVGEWVGPGYSTYLHPFGENHLIAMGVDENWRTGITLYDLTDFAVPRLVERQPLLGAGYQTAALHEHKAFTFNPETGELLLPFHDWDHATGVLRYLIDESGIDLEGTLDMSEDIRVEGPARRAMYNGDILIGLGACRITSAALADPSEVISSLPIYDDACALPGWYY